MNSQRRQLLALGSSAAFVSALGISCRKPLPPPDMDAAPGFWVWHRGSEFNAEEIAALAASGNGRIYRQIGEFGTRNGRWSPRPVVGGASMNLGSAIPVLRLDAGNALLETPGAAEAVARWLRFHRQDHRWERLQIDYDCPERLLARYSRFLSELREALVVRELSATALAGWIHSPRLKSLARAVDEMVPMFYDLQADEPAAVASGTFRPLVGTETCEWIRKWSACGIHWRAGLINLQRLSLFRADGRLVGHLRQWSPEDLIERRELEPVSGSDSNSAAWRVVRDGMIRGTRLAKDQVLVWRVPGDQATLEALTCARTSGAASIVWFALPGPGLRAARSVRHLAGLAEGTVPKPELALFVRNNALVLENQGRGDLAADPGAPLSRVTVDLGRSGVFTGGPGEFFAVRAENSLPRAYARRVVLSFAGLSAGATISTQPGSLNLDDHAPLDWTLLPPSS
jgi:hypothetical protein